MDVAVVIVGDEILAGHVHDANTPFIAGRLAALGHRLIRATVIGDDPSRIAAEIRRERDEGARLVVVCGGLGSTHDDRTMEGVAAALGRGLSPCEPLMEVIERVIAAAVAAGFRADAIGADAMRKMGLAPDGAEALRCSVPFIPAVAVDDEDFTVAVLPGPPDQLARVFTEALEPRCLSGTGEDIHRHELRHSFPESTFASLLTDLAERYPAASIGSYPQRDHTLIRLAGAGDDVRALARSIADAIDAIASSEEGKRFLDYLAARRGARA